MRNFDILSARMIRYLSPFLIARLRYINARSKKYPKKLIGKVFTQKVFTQEDMSDYSKII